MSDNNDKGHLKPWWSPATYRIEVEGRLKESRADGFAGMRITARKIADLSIVTCLTGRVMDQSERTGMLEEFAELHVCSVDESVIFRSPETTR